MPNAGLHSPPPAPIKRNVLASPLPPRAYIRVCFACSGRLEAEEEGAGRLCPPLPSWPCPLATQFQLRCNARSFAQRTLWLQRLGWENAPQLRRRARKPEAPHLPPAHSGARRWRRRPHGCVHFGKSSKHEDGRSSSFIGFYFFKARSPRVLPFCIESIGRRFGFCMEYNGAFWILEAFLP